MRQLFVWNEQAGEARGPFELTQVEELFESGELEPQTLVAARGEALWTSLSEHAETSAWVERAKASQAILNKTAPPQALYERAQALQSAQLGSPKPCATYDPDYELEFLELNPGNHRRLRDYALLATGLNAGLAIAYFFLPMEPISATVLISSFVGGNISLSWIFGLVLNY